MRIISQNGMDFPYEHIVVILDGRNVICRPVSNMAGRYYPLGAYKTEERAQDVFSSINKSYCNFILMDGDVHMYDQTVFIMPEE